MSVLRTQLASIVTVTKLGWKGRRAVVVECEHCGRPFEGAQGVGRPRRYCRRSCRQRAYERRRHQGDVAWGDARLVGMARELAELEDRMDRARDLVDQLRFDVEDGRPIDEEVLGQLGEQLSGGVQPGRLTARASRG